MLEGACGCLTHHKSYALTSFTFGRRIASQSSCSKRQVGAKQKQRTAAGAQEANLFVFGNGGREQLSRAQK